MLHPALCDQSYRLMLELTSESSPGCHWPPPVASLHLNSVSFKPAAVHSDPLINLTKLIEIELIFRVARKDHTTVITPLDDMLRLTGNNVAR